MHPRPTILGPTLLLALGSASAAQAAPASLPAPSLERPYGNALGDGLRLSDHAPEPTQSVVCADGETLMGIDVSYYQGDIDWNAVAADGVTFAWVRVSHSLQFFDPQFEANLAGARAAGVHTGVYQYFEPSEDPVAQADLLLESMGPLLPGDMPPMIDVESQDPVAAGAYVDAIQAWIDRIEEVTGVQPFIYTGYYYWNDNVGGSGQFASYPLWIANYNAGCPLIPDVWASWTIHQYCACESVAGISGAVDGDTFNGNLDDLMGLAVGAGVCGDGICDGTEDEFSCVSDCPPCGVIPPEGGTIDDDDACHERYGPEQYWRTEADGIGGQLHWTAATELEDPSNFAIWRLYFEESGLYSVEVHVQSPWAETHQAAYRISHAGGEDVELLDQAAADGWRLLTNVQFDAASDHWVRLDDNTGEPVAEEIGIVYDALRVTRLDGGGDSTGGANDTGEDPDGTTDPGGTTLPGGTGGSGDSEDTFALPPLNDGDDGGGCGCRSTTPSRATPGLLLLLALGLRRRRARTG
ncbi:MAG: glycoside hydrolase family 25 protein [Myxococcales bacterium]|nr:glycoside hydrolase family 25 protein [Myxococcales bacterium]MCB9716960.1 glycoside hydrolase family 25 protein [Myxococcales bacterium]